MSATTGSNAPRAARLTGAGLVAAFVVLVAFAAFVVFLIGETDAGEVRWARLAWLFTSVEAIAFGAAGALFGSSIQRSRAEKAEQAAQENAATPLRDALSPRRSKQRLPTRRAQADSKR